ncbi:MAG: ATP-binding protein, partial [Deltaproteobacteria bacterium]|nr:ATP-binding protein [Deltaproteobacteria bacterium]
VKTMLEVGRKTPPARMRVNLRPIVEEVVTLAKSQKESVRIELTQEEEIWGDVDPRQIRQVLWNVIRNAIQFSPEGGAVHIALKRASQEAIVEISDEGPGIPEKEREAIFDMFFSKRPSGFGLGLALSRQIVEAHGGHIEVLDRKPHGSRFVIRIPDLPSKTPSLTLGPTPHAAQ